MEGPELNSLGAEIQKARDLLRTLEARQAHFFRDHAIIRYLYSAVGSAEVLMLALEADHPFGTAPNIRALLEVYYDLIFLKSVTDGDKWAARSFLAEVREVKKDRGTYREIRALLSDSEAIPYLAGSGNDTAMSVIVSQMDESNSRRGGRKGTFKEAWAELQQSQHWHWTGKDRSTMVEELKACGRLSSVEALQAISLHSKFAAWGHASPGWLKLPVETRDDGSHWLLDPASYPPESSHKNAEIAADLLELIYAEVKSAGVPASKDQDPSEGSERPSAAEPS